MFAQYGRWNGSLFAAAALLVQADENGQGTPWWAWLLLIVLIIVLAWLLFGRKTSGELRATEQSRMPMRSMAETKAPAAAAAEPAEPVRTMAPVEPVEPIAPDDLTRIEGIGPKISSVLQAAGIKTFAQLNVVTAAQLEQIMKEGEIRIAYPETWPEQAGLAAANDWEGLAKLQEKLKGGRHA